MKSKAWVNGSEGRFELGGEIFCYIAFQNVGSPGIMFAKTGILKLPGLGFKH